MTNPAEKFQVPPQVSGMVSDTVQRYTMQNTLITELLIAEREKLKARLDEINGLLGGPYVPKAKASIGSQINASATGGKPKRVMSDEAKAKIAAAQRARWAKQKKGK